MGLYRSLQDDFPAFLQRVLTLKGDHPGMRMHERVAYLVFVINAFQVGWGCGCHVCVWGLCPSRCSSHSMSLPHPLHQKCVIIRIIIRYVQVLSAPSLLLGWVGALVCGQVVRLATAAAALAVARLLQLRLI